MVLQDIFHGAMSIFWDQLIHHKAHVMPALKDSLQVQQKPFVFHALETSQQLAHGQDHGLDIIGIMVLGPHAQPTQHHVFMSIQQYKPSHAAVDIIHC